MASIDRIFQMLSWNNDEETQEKGLREAKKLQHLFVFFQPIVDQPMSSKAVWENCAKVIASKNDAALERYFYPMFEWLQDMNWPGAQRIFDRLLAFPAEKLKWVFQDCLEKATALDDFSWEHSLMAFQQEYKLQHPESDLEAKQSESYPPIHIVRTGDDSLF